MSKPSTLRLVNKEHALLTLNSVSGIGPRGKESSFHQLTKVCLNIPPRPKRSWIVWKMQSKRSCLNSKTWLVNFFLMCPRKKISSPFSLGWSQRTASRRRKRRKQPASWRPVKISYLFISFVVCFFLAHIYKYCFILFFFRKPSYREGQKVNIP